MKYTGVLILNRTGMVELRAGPSLYNRIRVPGGGHAAWFIDLIYQQLTPVERHGWLVVAGCMETLALPATLAFVRLETNPSFP
jgi:hypothetical protein